VDSSPHKHFAFSSIILTVAASAFNASWVIIPPVDSPLSANSSAASRGIAKDREQSAGEQPAPVRGLISASVDSFIGRVVIGFRRRVPQLLRSHQKK